MQEPQGQSTPAEAQGETQTLRWQRLMEAAQSGDQRAYATLLREAAVFVRLIARRYHSDTTALEDVVQETLISMHRARHTHEPGLPVEPWIAAIAKSRAIDGLRTRRRQARLAAQLSNEAHTTSRQSADTEEGRFATQSQVIAALETLPPGQRAAVQMLKIQEMSLSDAARASGKSMPALKSLLHRAMLALRETLNGGRDA